MQEFHAGDVVGQYRLEARVGGGGFGSVWRARHTGSGRIYALKLLPELEGNPQAGHLAAEIELLAAAAAGKSPHIVQVFEGGTDPAPYVVMEFVSGTSLEEELRQRRRLTQAETIDIGLAVAEALGAVGSVGIVHRDVKPSNVLIQRDGTVKLGDFGIAKIVGFDTATMTGQLPLSISYASPEAWEGKAEHRSDLYSLGILLYQCLAGQPPFRGGYAELFYHHRSTEPDLAALPADTPASLRALIDACLKKRPEERPANASACIALLESAKTELADGPAPATTVAHEPERFGPWIVIERINDAAWTWRCRHESTDETARVEVMFADEAAYGDELRRAVAPSRQLAPLGAELLLGTNRLILRPGEAWREAPPAPFAFWLAREDVDEVETPVVVTAPILLHAVEGMLALIDATNRLDLPISFAADKTTVLANGALFVRGVGLPVAPTTDAVQEGLETLRALPLTRDLRPVVFGARRLEDVRKAAAIVTTLHETPGVAGGSPSPPPTTRSRPTLAAPTVQQTNLKRKPVLFALGIAALVLGALIGGYLLSHSNEASLPPQDGDATPTPTGPAVATCLALVLPAPLGSAIERCGPAGATFVEEATCPRGFACTRSTAAGLITIGQNSKTLVAVDESGNLALTTADGKTSNRLTNHGAAREPAWSPDGRYLTYVEVLKLPQAKAEDPQRYATQLRVIEADRPANDGIVIATNGSEASGLTVASPQWSADGRTLYFLWLTSDGRGIGLHAVDLPMTSTDIDFSTLRSAAPADQVIMPDRVNTLAITAADFGVNDGYVARFSVTPAGTIFVQVCDGPNDLRRCGLGRWDGAPKLLLPLTNDVAYGPPAVNGDVLLVPAWRRNQGWRLQQYGLDGTQVNTGTNIPLTAIEDPLGLPVPHIAPTGHGDEVVVEAPPNELRLVHLTDGKVDPLSKGSAPTVFVPRVQPAAVVEPGASPYVTPTPTPTPTPTLTPTPTQLPRTPTPTLVPPTPGPGAQPMTLSITVVRGTTPLPNAVVVATVGTDECASATADGNGRAAILFPASNTAPRCREPGATINFKVNGIPISTSTSFSPGNILPITLNAP